MRQHPKGSPRLPFVVFGLLATAAMAGGCATGDESLPQDVAQLRNDLNALTLAVHRSRAETETSVGQTDRRTRAESAETARQVNALSTRLDNIAAELGRVSARLEDVSGRLDALSRQVAARGSAPAAPAASPRRPRPRSPPPRRGGRRTEPAPSRPSRPRRST